jgi:acyl-CoA thioester hydrolase
LPGSGWGSRRADTCSGARDRQAIARAETIWVFVDAAKGRPRRIPDAFRAAFDVVTDEKHVLRHLEPGPAGKPTSPP